MNLGNCWKLSSVSHTLVTSLNWMDEYGEDSNRYSAPLHTTNVCTVVNLCSFWNYFFWKVKGFEKFRLIPTGTRHLCIQLSGVSPTLVTSRNWMDEYGEDYLCSFWNWIFFEKLQVLKFQFQQVLGTSAYN